MSLASLVTEIILIQDAAVSPVRRLLLICTITDITQGMNQSFNYFLSWRVLCIIADYKLER